MSNCYKNIMKNFAHKLNEQQMPAEQQHEEKVKLTQAEDVRFDFENPPATIELENGKNLKYVSSLKDQVKGKVKRVPSYYEFISVYVDDSNKKYIVFDNDWDNKLSLNARADLAGQSWAKRFESGALPPDAIVPYWGDIVAEGESLAFIDGNAVETFAKAIESLKLDAKKAKKMAEGIWGRGESLEDIMAAIAIMNNKIQEFLTDDTDRYYDVKGYDDKLITAMRYEFEV